MASAEFLEGRVDDFSKDDDDDMDDRSHKKLLNAVSSLYRKQRISAPKRNEPSLQISEYNLTKTEQKKKLAPTELLKGLGTKAVHQQIHSKIKDAKQKSNPLPKPLEKFEAEKITRETGYENVTKEISKWDAIIQKNRAADQLVFPLRDSGWISMEPERDILGTFSKPTELESKMADVLNKSPTIKVLREEAQAEKLTLAQLIQRRNMIAKMRHRESYRIAKAVRQNKIKSKKYHRMLKRDKIKNELKEFELLQKTDPEAALAKLEKVERARAEERISLRHRNTGKWAKGLAIRAKYDTEARAQLADNLRKSRELTEKVKASIVSDSEDEVEDDEMEMDDTGKSTGNPWVNSENEISSFVKGYRKFWEEQNKSIGGSEGIVGIKKSEKSKTVSSQELGEEIEKNGSESNDDFYAEGHQEYSLAADSEDDGTAEEIEQIGTASENGAKDGMSVDVIGKAAKLRSKIRKDEKTKLSDNVHKKEVKGLKSKGMKMKKDSSANVGSEPCSAQTSTSGTTKPRHKKTDLRKVNKKLIKPGNKKAAMSGIIQGKKLGGKNQIKRKSNKSAKAGKPAGQSKSRIQFHCFEKPVNED